MSRVTVTPPRPRYDTTRHDTKTRRLDALLFAPLSHAVGCAVDEQWPEHDPFARDCSCLDCIARAEVAAARKLDTMHGRCVICGGLLTCWQLVTHWSCRG